MNVATETAINVHHFRSMLIDLLGHIACVRFVTALTHANREM
jgi:hypothetical protein